MGSLLLPPGSWMSETWLPPHCALPHVGQIIDISPRPPVLLPQVLVEELRDRRRARDERLVQAWVVLEELLPAECEGTSQRSGFATNNIQS